MSNRTSSWPTIRAVVGFIATLTIVLLGIIAVVVWCWLNVPTILAGQISLAGLFFVFFFGWVMLRVIRTQRFTPSGVLLNDEQKLAVLCRQLASEAKTSPPDEIWLTTELVVTITDDSRWLGLSKDTRRLTLGFAYVAGLSAAELAALIAAELGRYSTARGRLAEPAYRCAALARRFAGELDTTNPLGGPIHGGLTGAVLRNYGAIVSRSSSVDVAAQAHAADHIAAGAVGADAVADGLRRAEALDVAWDVFLDQYLRWGWESGYRPLGCLAGFRQLLIARADALEELTAAELDDDLPRWDSQATIAERVESLGSTSATVEPPAPGPASELINDFERRTDELETVFMADADRPALPWPEFMARAAAVSSQQAAAELYRAAATVANVGEPTLAIVLDLLDQAKDAELVAAITGVKAAADEYVQASEHVAELLGNACAAAAVAAGVGWWRMSWENPISIVGADGEQQPWHELADEAIIGRVDPLRNYLAEVGIDPRTCHPTSVGASVGHNWTAALSDVKVEGFTYDALLHTGGLVLAPMAGVQPSMALADGRRRLGLWFTMLPSDVAKLPGAMEIANVDIVLARVVPGRPLVAELALLDGRLLRLRASRLGAEAGSGAEAFVQFFAAYEWR